INHYQDPKKQKDYEEFIDQDYGTSMITARVYGIEWSSLIDQVVTIRTVTLLEKKTSDAVGYDLYTYESIVLDPGQGTWIRTGIKMKIPTGFEGRIQGRSGDTKKGL